jgi:hypothetical protein
MMEEIKTISKSLSNGKKLSSVDPESNARNMRIMNNLAGCVVSASDVVSETRSIISIRSSASGITSVQGDAFPDFTTARVQEWRNHLDDFPTTTMPMSRSATPSSTTSRFTTNHNSQQQSSSNSERQTTTSAPTNLNGNGNADNDYDLEAVLIKQWHNRAVVQFAQNQYATAEPYLRKALSRSQEKYGQEFRGKEELLRILALSCAQQAKEEDVFEIFDGQHFDFEWKETVLHTLLWSCIKENTLDKVERVATKYGSESRSVAAALPQLVSSYSTAERWELAESVLDRYQFRGRDKAICEMLSKCCEHPISKPAQPEAERSTQSPQVEESPTIAAFAASRKSRRPSFADASCCRDRWDKSESLLDKYTLFHGREKVLRLFIDTCLDHNDIPATFQLIQRYPTGMVRKELMLNCLSFSKKKRNWDGAEWILQEFLATETMHEFEAAKIRSELGYIHLQKKELDLAEKFCLEAIQTWKKSLGRFQSEFQYSVYICAWIYLEKGDIIEAEGYQALLSRKYYGRLLLKRLLIIECLQYGKWARNVGEESELNAEIHELLSTLVPEEPIPKRYASAWVTSQFSPALEWRWQPQSKSLSFIDTRIRAAQVPGCSVLHGFASAGNEIAVRMLLDFCGYSVELRDIHGRTPLHIAALYGHEAIIKILLKYGAGVDVKDYSAGRTALFFAAAGNRKRCVKLLLEEGASRSEKDQLGSVASSFSSDEAIYKLLGPPPPLTVALRTWDDTGVMENLVHALRPFGPRGFRGNLR